MLLFPPSGPSDHELNPGSALPVDGAASPGGVVVAPRDETLAVLTVGSALSGPRSTGADLVLDDSTIPAGAERPSRVLLTVLEGTRPENPGSGFGARIVQLGPDTSVTGRDGPWGKQWQHMLSDTGSGQYNVQLDNPAAELIDYGHVTRWQVDGRNVFASIVEGRAQATAAQGEEVDEFVTITGRGILAALDQGVVYPWGGLERQPYADQRVFNWASPSLPTWGTSDLIVGQWRAAVVSSSSVKPESWPDLASAWVWDRPVTGNGAPRGTCYFRKRFTTPRNTLGAYESAFVQVWAAGGGPARPGYNYATTSDDEWEVWIDGVLVLESQAGETGEAAHADLLLSPGEHLIAVKCANNDGLRAGMICAVQHVDRQGSMLGNLARTDASWIALGYPRIPPGHSAGRVMLTLIREARDRGSCLQVSHIFDELVDEDGVPWPVEPEITVPVGATLLEVAQQLAENHADIDMGPGAFLLRMWRIDEQGSARLVSFEPGVNVASLSHRTES